MAVAARRVIGPVRVLMGAHRCLWRRAPSIGLPATGPVLESGGPAIPDLGGNEAIFQKIPAGGLANGWSFRGEE